MKTLKAKINFSFKNKNYKANQEIKINNKIDLKDIWKLNEKGFIEPLSEKEFIEIIKSFDKKSKKDEEE